MQTPVDCTADRFQKTGAASAGWLVFCFSGHRLWSFPLRSQRCPMLTRTIRIVNFVLQALVL